MNKNELIQIHTLMVMMKEYFEKRGLGKFFEYNALKISPVHIHKNKYEHKDAIFILGKEIIAAINDDPIVTSQILGDNINNLYVNWETDKLDETNDF